MKNTHNTSQHHLSDELLKPNPIIEQIHQSYTFLDELSKPSLMIEQMQQSTQLYEQLYKTDIISSFTSKLKDIEYSDDNLVNQVEETKPMVDVLKSLPKEFQETLIEKVKLYIDEQVDIKVSKKLKETTSEINSSRAC